ncbi:MAG: helix-turn-helix domain containing protein [Nanoarchaeota archaeon]|nr:helix-turn-helix domain containing protein [Nanoarchaeota archaeon]
MAYTLRKKRYYVKQALLGLTQISEICRNRKVPRRTLYRWIAKYKQYGNVGLENKCPGIKELIIKDHSIDTKVPLMRFSSLFRFIKFAKTVQTAFFCFVYLTFSFSPFGSPMMMSPRTYRHDQADYKGNNYPEHDDWK